MAPIFRGFPLQGAAPGSAVFSLVGDNNILTP